MNVSLIRPLALPQTVSQNLVVEVIAQNLFDVTPKFDGDNFFTRVDGKLMATPMFISVAVIEISDLIFAVSSQDD